jgi:PTS hybrid protein
MNRVGLVVVSHSAGLADGVVEVAGQMAPDVVTVAAGGTGDGGIGTDFDAVSAAVERADGGVGVVLLYDLGSARMVADMVVETLDDPESAVVVDAPLVEGTVAAAVAAQGGVPLVDVVAAAREAAGLTASPSHAPSNGDGVIVVPDENESVGVVGDVDVVGSMSLVTNAPVVVEEIVVPLTNEIGLHARPAALVARAMATLDARVTVRFGDAKADGRSVLALMGLGARGGDEVRVSATGRQAAEALAAFEDLAARNFSE